MAGWEQAEVELLSPSIPLHEFSLRTCRPLELPFGASHATGLWVALPDVAWW